MHSAMRSAAYKRTGFATCSWGGVNTDPPLQNALNAKNEMRMECRFPTLRSGMNGP